MRQAAARNFLESGWEAILVFDGGMGTSIGALELGPEDFGGHPGCNEILVKTRPDVIGGIHARFLEAGATVIETNSFGGAAHVLAEHGLEAECFELNRQSASIARRVAADFSSRPGDRFGRRQWESDSDEGRCDERPRYVAGSIGPGSKLPSLRQIGFDDLVQSYAPQVDGLMAGGVDCLIVETCQDLLQAKAALAAIEAAFARGRRRVPLIVQVTIDANGRTLVGSDVSAVLAVLESLPVDAIGLNCGTGPEGMAGAVLYLAEHSSKLLSVMPNAGLPKMAGGTPSYDLQPRDFGFQMAAFARNPGLNIAGGCCGTDPEHIRALVSALAGVSPRKPAQRVPRLASLYQAQEIRVEPRPLFCGERANASGSRKFRELLLAGDFPGLVGVALEQQEEGAHLVDVSVAVAGRDEKRDLVELVRRLNTAVDLPLAIDSTSPEAIEVALKHLGGRPVVNSINLEDGGKRARRVVELCRKHGAAVIGLVIDERGMAMTLERKLEVAERLSDVAVVKGGLAPEDLFLDYLTFTLASGDEMLRDAAKETLRAIAASRQRFPGSHTSLGVSNVSYGLPQGARKYLNTVFLSRAVEHGLDAAILHAGRVLPLHEIEPELVVLCDDLIFNRATGPETPLERLLSYLDHIGRQPAADSGRSDRPALAPVDPKARLRQIVLSGDARQLGRVLQELLPAATADVSSSALAIVEGCLLPAMAEVGELFRTGKMHLPFVLRSAQVMREGLELLRPRLGRMAERRRAPLVLATVRGDVHDIGKNLVDMIVSSNGFRVVNLGVRQTPENILVAVREHGALAVGLSGLLTESARQMKEYLQVFGGAGLTVPVLCGGAALSRGYVTDELQPVYPGKVYYAADAMEGLRIMQAIAGCAPSHSEGTQRHPDVSFRGSQTTEESP